MIRLFIFIITLLIGQNVYADLLNSSYVSPEHYAINEADMVIDYSHIPPAPQFNFNNIDNVYTQSSEINNNTNINNAYEEIPSEPKTIENQTTNYEKDSVDEAYKKRLSYKFAKWWVDQRYKREEPHHGDLHEIKIQKRIDYEKKLEMQKNQSQ